MTDDQDQARFEQIYRRHFRAVLRYALARVDPERAKDVTAETFLVAWRRLPEVPSDPRPWLFGVARRVIAGQFRSDTRREALNVRLQTVQDPREGVGDLADEVAEREAVLAAFARLGDNDRDALRLVTWDGLTPGQAAEALGVSRLTFAVRLHRARRRLATELTATDGPPSVQPERAGRGSRRGLDVAAFGSHEEVRRCPPERNSSVSTQRDRPSFSERRPWSIATRKIESSTGSSGPVAPPAAGETKRRSCGRTHVLGAEPSARRPRRSC